MLTDKHLEYCTTPKQRAVIEAVLKHGSNNKAAKAIGIARQTVDRNVTRVKLTAAQMGYAPDHDMTHTVPDGFTVKGVSTLYDMDGNPKAQWVKSCAKEQEAIESLKGMIIALAEDKDIPGRSKPTKAPAKVDKDLITVIPFGDPHIGMYAYARETGNDFDCDIAQASLFGAVDKLCEIAPPTETAIILSVGDTFHADTSDNRSLNSGHSFDVDTRWQRVLEIGVLTFKRCIDRALQKHKTVIFRGMSGNHDYHTSQMLNLCLSLYYENNPRVIVDTSPSYFWFYRFGKVLLGSTHGDSVKPEKLPAIMADEVAEDWGASEHRYWYTGHIHTKNKIEFRGCVWESFRTLAGRDAWHAKMGYKAGRDLYAIIHHKDFGEVMRHRVDIRMLKTK